MTVIKGRGNSRPFYLTSKQMRTTKNFKKIEASYRKPTILKNPSFKTLEKLMKNVQHKELKGLISGKDVYWWNQVEDWHHFMQYEKLNKGITDPEKNPDWNNDCLYLIQMYAKDNSHPILLGNKNIKDGVYYILDNKYLNNMIKQNGLYIDNPEYKLGDDEETKFINGAKYINKIRLESNDFNELLCWITDKGKIIYVTDIDKTHAGAFRQLYNSNLELKNEYDKFSSNLNQYSIYMFTTRDLGWIRVSGHGKYFSAMVTKNKIAPKAVYALSRILKDYNYNEFVLDYYSSYDEGGYKEFYRLPDLLAELRKNINKTLTASFDEYGFWLEDNGKIITVSYQGHDRYLRQHLNKEELSHADYHLNVLKDKGWIRAVNENRGNLSLEFVFGRVSKGALRALSELIKLNIYNGYIVEIKKERNTILTEDLRQRWFMFKEGQENQLLNLVRRCLSKEITANNEDYGYFITDKGGLLKVDYQDHSGVADKYIHNHLYTEYLTWVQKNDVADSTDFMLYKGGIRIVLEGQVLGLNISQQGITREAFNTLKKFYNSHYFDRVYLDVEGNGDPAKDKSATFSEFDNNLSKFLGYLRGFIRSKTIEASAIVNYLKENVFKTVVDIDENNNITDRFEETTLETWQPDNSLDRIYLLKSGRNFLVRLVEKAVTLDFAFRFEQTGRDALLKLVDGKAKQGLFYKKHSQPEISHHVYASDEKVLQRWQTKGGKYAITLNKTTQGFYISNFIKNIKGDYIPNGTSFLGNADLEEATNKLQQNINGLSSLDGGFIKVSAKARPKIQDKQKIAQITVRNNKSNKDGFTKFTKQPNIPGLTVYISKVGSYQYAQIKHDVSGYNIVNLTSSPLKFSPSELVERLNYSSLKNFNWTLDSQSLFNKYGVDSIKKATENFISSLDQKMKDKTDLALDSGLKNWVKDYLISRYFGQVRKTELLKKQIDAQIRKEGLNKERVYMYYGNPGRSTERVWEKIGLKRSGDSAPYKYSFANAQDYKTETNVEPVKEFKHYGWATVAGRARKSYQSITYKDATIGYTVVDDAEIAKTIVSFGNKENKLYHSQYIGKTKLVLEKSKNFNVNASYVLSAKSKHLAEFRTPSPDIWRIVANINKAIITSEPTQKIIAKRPIETNQALIGKYVYGLDKSDIRQEGILLTQKYNIKTYRSSGILLTLAGKKIEVSNARRKLTKPPTKLIKLYKSMQNET